MGLDQLFSVRPHNVSFSEFVDVFYSDSEEKPEFAKHGLTLRKANMIHKWVMDRKKLNMDDYNGKEVELSLCDVKTLMEKCEESLNLMIKSGILYPVYDDQKDSYVRFTHVNGTYSFERFDLDGYHMDLRNTDFVFNLETTIKLQKILPTKDGFFFGTCLYGIDYAMDVLRAYVGLKDLIEFYVKNEGMIIRYESDW